MSALISLSFAQNVVFGEFDSNFASYDNIKKDKLYDKIKHVYIESIMNDDNAVKYESLVRLISGAKALGYDYLGYEKELNTLTRTYPNITLNTKGYTDKNSGLIKTSNANDKPSNNSAVYAGDIVKLEQTANYVAADDKAKANVDTKVNAPQSLKLTEVSQEDGKIIFTFDKKPNDIKKFILKGDGFRYVYDVRAVKTDMSIDVKIDTIKDLRISQFDKDTLRIVFEHSKEMNITQSIDGQKLIFGAREFIKTSAKSTQTKTDNKSDTTKSAANSTALKVLLPQKTVVIDAGHGGKDSGAVSNKKFEKTAVLQIALLLGTELEKRGYKVYYTRTKDIYLKLRDRTKTANDKNADIFVSIHANAAPNKSDGNWQGVETYFLSPTDSKRSKNAAELENQSDVEEMNFYSKQTFLNFLNREKIIASHKLAIDIQQYILTSLKKSYTKVVDGGVREGPFWVLTGAQMPAVLLEVGYITDKTERERIFDKKFQQILVIGIADGIDSYFVKNM